VRDLPVVLVTEDDQLVQEAVEEALALGGFKTAAARTGEEAVNLLRAGHTQYHALVTDVRLAGNLDGWEVARVPREINANFPVIYMTGAAGGDWASKGVPNSILLNKPFAPAQLITAVSKLLNAAPPATKRLQGRFISEVAHRATATNRPTEQ
jgi:DNA-binding response OmpR family regulator